MKAFADAEALKKYSGNCRGVYGGSDYDQCHTDVQKDASLGIIPASILRSLALALSKSCLKIEICSQQKKRKQQKKQK